MTDDPRAIIRRFLEGFPKCDNEACDRRAAWVDPNWLHWCGRCAPRSDDLKREVFTGDLEEAEEFLAAPPPAHDTDPVLEGAAARVVALWEGNRGLSSWEYDTQSAVDALDAALKRGRDRGPE